MEEIAINPTIELPEHTQDWEIGSRRAQQNLVHQDPGERNSDPTGDCPDLPVGVRESPAKAWVHGGLLRTVAVHAWDLLREVTILFITSTIVSIQFSRSVPFFIEQQQLSEAVIANLSIQGS